MRTIPIAIFFTILNAFLGCSSSAETSAGASGAGSTLRVWMELSGEDPYLIREVHFDAEGNNIEELRYPFIEKGPPESREVSEYNEKGQPLEKHSFDGGGNLLWKIDYQYDERDSLLAYACSDAQGALTFTLYSLYDANGRNVKDSAVSADGRLYFEDLYALDGEGKRVSWIRNKMEKSIDSESGLEVERKVLDHRVDYNYDSLGRSIGYVGSGSIGGTYVYEYNSDGKVGVERAWNTADSSFLWTIVKLYDEEGRLREELEYDVPDHETERPNRVRRYEYGPAAQGD